MIAVGDIVLHDDETALSFFSRVASDYRQTLDQFCKNKGTTVAGLASGGTRALRRVCEQWKLDPGSFIGRSILSKGGLYQIHDERNLYRKLDWKSVRYCPRCVATDMESGYGKLRTRPYQRLAWLSPYVFQCATHQVDLVDRSAAVGQSNAGDFAWSMLPVIDELGRNAAPPPCWPDASSGYFHGRMRPDFATGCLLDPMPTFAAAEVCIAFGTMAASRHPDAGLRPKLSDGYRIVRDGRDSILAFLDAHCVIGSLGRRRTIRDIYGAIYDLLRGNRRAAFYEPVREYVMTHGLDNLPLGETESFLGGRVAKRRFHTVHSASVEYGLSQRDVMAALEQHGVLDPKARYGSDKFAVERIDAVLSEAANPRVSLSQVRSRTGLTDGIVTNLVSRGVLRRHGPTNRPWFWLDEIERFSASLFGNVKCSAPRDAVPIFRASVISRTPRHELVIAILEGRVQAFSDRGQATTLQDLLVERSDLPNRKKNHPKQQKMRLKGTKPSAKGDAKVWQGFMAFAPAMRRLSVGDVTMRHLLEAGYLPFSLSPGGVHNIPVDAVEQFMATYIPFHEVRKLACGKTAALSKRLTDRGVLPAIDSKFSNIARFYLRTEVMALLSDWSDDHHGT